MGGPGLGKTTLLAQAIAENRLMPRGDDVWVGVEDHDADAGRLAHVVATAVVRQGDDRAIDRDVEADRARTAADDPRVVAEAVWQRAPTEACIVFDDVHLLPPDSSGAAWLADLVDVLPANGHVVVASRPDPPIPLARAGSAGDLLWLGEDELRFSEEELAWFAEGRGLDPAVLRDTGGWPAVAELAASVEKRLAGDYLWEEVLAPLGTVRRHVLAVLRDLGGGDDALMSAVLGAPVDLDDDLRGVPLLGRGSDGWYVPHSLWQTVPGMALEPAERVEVRRRAVGHLAERGRHDDAFTLLREAELWDEAPAILRSACLVTHGLVPAELGSWLARCPAQVLASPAGRLATGLHDVFAAPEQVPTSMGEARARAQELGDVEMELVALAQLGRDAWYRNDTDTLGEIAMRTLGLEATGLREAQAAAACARAGVADLVGDDEGIVRPLAAVESQLRGTSWEELISWLWSTALLELGQDVAAMEVADRFPGPPEMAETMRLLILWRRGEVDDVLTRLPRMMDLQRRAAPRYAVYLTACTTSLIYSQVGDVANGRRLLEEAVALSTPVQEGDVDMALAAATAALAFAEGDEKSAAETLRHALAHRAVDEGPARRWWRYMLALSYVLLPESRERWDAARLDGFLGQARELARATVVARSGDGERRLRTLDLPDLGIVRAALPLAFAAELAVALSAVGRGQGAKLLDSLGPGGREAVRTVAASPARRSKAARALLDAVPAPPPQASYLAVLGPLELRRDGPEGDEVVDADLRRQRVQELLAFLVAHRKTTRPAITAALWPDLDERAAANNLGVTVNHLLRVLEPWRPRGEPAYLVRVEGQQVRLVTDDHLRLDLDDFDEHLRAAAVAEREGTPSQALEHNLAAFGLYRDELHAGLPEAGWFALDREHYRTRFLAAGTRAAQLLLGRGDVDQAQAVAHRVLRVDPWSEAAYATLVGAALARNDRSSARRLLDRCMEALADLGVDPSPSTRQLQHRLLAA